MHCLLNFSKPISNFDIIILAVDFMETLCGFEGFKMTSYVAWFWTIHFFKYISIWIRNFVPSSKLCLLAHFTAAYKLDQRCGSVVWIFSMVHRMMEAAIRNSRKFNQWKRIGLSQKIKGSMFTAEWQPSTLVLRIFRLLCLKKTD